MKQTFKTLFAATCLAAALTACKKDARETANNEEVSQEAMTKIAAMGFSTEGVKKVEGGYLVENDIVLSQENLNGLPTSNEIIYANEEHYRTTYTVNTTNYSTIRVAIASGSSSHNAAFTAALDEAIRRYNALGLRIRFQRVTSSPNITVEAYYQVSNTLGSAGFPTSGGAPFNRIRMNTYWYSTSTGSTNVNYIATVMAHEMGHCIGFRHTDYMNRAYSCGGTATNEGTAGVGAIHIPGTPTGPSANSWMLACTGNNQNRPFTSADQTALNYVY